MTRRRDRIHRVEAKRPRPARFPPTATIEHTGVDKSDIIVAYLLSLLDGTRPRGQG